jgi:hypothetical protein
VDSDSLEKFGELVLCARVGWGRAPGGFSLNPVQQPGGG